MELIKGLELELVKSLTYYENIEEVEYTEELPVGRQAIYLGKREPRVVNVYKEIHPEYINSQLMHYPQVIQPGGHLVAVKDQKGWDCWFTFKDEEELFAHMKIREGTK